MSGSGKSCLLVLVIRSSVFVFKLGVTFDPACCVTLSVTLDSARKGFGVVEVGEVVWEEIVLLEESELIDFVLIISIDVSMVSLGVEYGQESVGSLNEQFKLQVKDSLFLWAKICPKQ
jgi:hypothetical protein